jgi:hypothetical protein
MDMKQEISTSPFTEIPDELKRGRPWFGRLVRGFFNTLFLIILGLALVALVIAFAYQLIYSPEQMGAWASGLIEAIEEVIRSVVPAS